MRKANPESGPTGFKFTSVLAAGGKRRTVARFVCHTCSDILDINIGYKTSAGEWYVQRARKHGWEADTVNDTLTRCPGCKDAAKKAFLRNRPDIGPTHYLPPPTPPVIVEETEAMPAAPQGSAQVTAIGDPERKYAELTFPQRRSILEALHAYFDGDSGLYTGGYNDQRIGEETGIGWAIVKYVRERDFGPLRLPSEAEVLTAKIEEVKATIHGLRSAWGQEIAQVKATYTAKLDELSQALTQMQRDMVEVKRKVGA